MKALRQRADVDRNKIICKGWQHTYKKGVDSTEFTEDKDFIFRMSDRIYHYRLFLLLGVKITYISLAGKK